MNSKLKLICETFNSSKNIDEFRIKIDLLGMTITDTTLFYMKECANIIEILKNEWCDKNGKFSFKKVFNSDFPVLPCNFKKSIKKEMIKYKLDAIGPNGQIFRQCCKSLRDISTTVVHYAIAYEIEIIHSLLYELNRSMKKYR